MHFAFEICPPLALVHTIHCLLRGNGIRWTEFAVEAVNCIAQRCEIVTPSYTSNGSCDALPTGPARPGSRYKAMTNATLFILTSC